MCFTFQHRVLRLNIPELKKTVFFYFAKRHMVAKVYLLKVAKGIKNKEKQVD